MKKDKVIKVKPNVDYTKYGFQMYLTKPAKVCYCVYNDDVGSMFDLQILNDNTLRIIHFNYKVLEILLKLNKHNLIKICQKE